MMELLASLGHVPVTAMDELADGVWQAELDAPEIAGRVQPGQYALVSCGDGDEPFFRRAMALDVSAAGALVLRWQERERGSRAVTREARRGQLDVLAPLGTSFAADPARPAILVFEDAGAQGLVSLARSLGRIASVHEVPGEHAHPAWGELLSSASGCPAEVDPLDDARIAAMTASALDLGATVYTFASTATNLRLLSAVDPAVPMQLGFGDAALACGTGICVACALPKPEGGYLRLCREGVVIDANRLR
jgi:hypothetical protein